MTDPTPVPPADQFPFHEQEAHVYRADPPQPEYPGHIAERFAAIAPRDNRWSKPLPRKTEGMTPEQKAIHDLLMHHYDQACQIKKMGDDLSAAKQAWKSWVRRERESSKYHQSLQNANPSYFDQMTISFPDGSFARLEDVLSESTYYY